MSTRDSILADIRTSLNRTASASVAPRPPIIPPRLAGSSDAEIEKLLNEVNALKGHAQCVRQIDLKSELQKLVASEAIQCAVLWNTERLHRLRVAEILRDVSIEIIPHTADKQTMARADLGITEADFLLPETGTIGLLSSDDKPRSVSLLPRVHLVIARRSQLCADLHHVFAQAKLENYLVLITGPSRTADIEMVVTIGVHGPQAYYLWILDD